MRKRILFTAAIILFARMASNIPCPGIDTVELRAYMGKLATESNAVGSFLSMFSMLSGGAIESFSLAALGIMPYITASIIIQLMTPVLPQLEKLQREGEVGRQKIQQYTRYFTLVICLVQGLFAALAIINPEKIGLPATTNSLILNIFDPGATMGSLSRAAFIILTVLVLTAGTMILVWLGDRITEKGIGNGASMIIMIGILARLPGACFELIEQFNSNIISLVHLFLYVLMFAGVAAFAVILTQGTRQIPIQMARKMMGSGRAATGTSTHLPLKVNYAGIMPIIFGGALLQIPPMLFGFIQQAMPEASWLGVAQGWFTYGTNTYVAIYAIMIIIFSYFWVANMFNPMKISDYLKRDGAYIPGVRPGQPTAQFLDGTMTRLTFAGALMLTALAILPMLLGNVFSMPMNIASFFGGTSLLIAVGVTLDTLNQMESHLVMRNYDGFLKQGRLRGRTGAI